MAKTAGKEPTKFDLRKAHRNATVKGTEAAAIAAATAAVTVPEPMTIAAIAGIAAVGGYSFGLFGEYMNHKTDDPLPVFDARTTLLFDTVGMVICCLLFVIPSAALDRLLGLNDPYQWKFFYMALFLSSFLVTIVRGMLCNFGIAREESDYRRSDLAQT